MYHPLFILSSVHGHWGCVHALAIVSDAAVTMGVQNISSKSCLQFFWVYTQKWGCWILWEFYV